MTSNGMNLNGSHLDSTPVQASFDRRGLFRIGGITIATAALVAACAENTIPGPVGRVGTGADNPTLADPVVNDGVLLRTAASIEISIAEAYKSILSKGWLAKAGATLPKMADQSSLVQQFADFHTASAATYNQQANVDAQLTIGADVVATAPPGVATKSGLGQKIAGVPGVTATSALDIHGKSLSSLMLGIVLMAAFLEVIIS